MLLLFYFFFCNTLVDSQILSQIFTGLRNGPRGGMDFGHFVGNIAADVSQSLGLNDADVIGDLRGASRLSPREWSTKARDFCRRYPGHPKCDLGKLPTISDIPSIINSVVYETGNLLPRVPMLNIRDPLSGLNPELVAFIKSLQSHFGMISLRDRNILESTCRFRRCNQQSLNTIKSKKTLIKAVADFDKSVGGNSSRDKINLQFDRTLQVKQALLKRANLSHIIVPSDNGVFDRDILLTEHQAEFLLNELGQAGVGADTQSTRFPRSGIFFQEDPVKKWDIWHPIPYTFDDSLEEADKQDIRNALHEISVNSCILFKYDSNPKGNHLKYIKVDSPTFCGLSYIGKTDPANPIYLSFQCEDNRGVAMHETLHALGINHQHLRIDRDKHIKIDWSNIDPQHYDTFAIADTKLYTSYGTPYAYDSIMHYNAYLAAINPSKPTIVPLINPKENTKILGQRAKLSRADIRLIKKMYCRPGCDDKNVHCGTWAIKGFCTNKKHNIWMATNCKASCDKC